MASRVIISDHFRQFEEQLDRGVQRSLGQAAGVGIASARAKETKVRTGKTRASIRALGPVTRTAKGFRIEYGATHFVARFVEKGTHARKGKAKTARTKARRQAAGVNNAGVRGIHFMRRSAKDSRVALEIALKRNLS